MKTNKTIITVANVKMALPEFFFDYFKIVRCLLLVFNT